MVLGKWAIHMQKNETTLLLLYTRINSKCIKVLNIRAETISYIEENAGIKVIAHGLRQDFMNLTSKTRGVKAK